MGPILRSALREWGGYAGPTLLEAMDLFEGAQGSTAAPFRFPVQGGYKFTEKEDKRRILAGRIKTGVVRVGERVTFSPSGQTSIVCSIEGKGQKVY